MPAKTTTEQFSLWNGTVEGIKLEWENFSLLLLTAPKGFLACGIFDVDAINAYGRAAALVEGAPDNPIGTLERMMERRIAKTNEKMRSIGIVEGMAVRDALELLF
jgi:uncharacterized protein YunC (DUF1805 family)